jgi:2'-hydroxyisoflavone reductase
MKLLIIGGTRFLGKQLVKEFIANSNYHITVLSRKAEIFKEQCEVVNMERGEGISEIQNQWFDLIIDFIAYDADAVKEVTSKIKFGKYVLISSCWMTKLNKKYSADEFITDINQKDYNELPNVTQEYLLNKRIAENYLNSNFDLGKFHVLRLPIFLGEEDHTKRLEFYISRFLDNKPIILINNGINYCQISSISDLSINICRIFLEGKIKNQPIIEALPTEKETLQRLLSIISKAISSKSELISINHQDLLKYFPIYLEKEPLWRENEIKISENNIFKILNTKSTLLSNWLGELSENEANKKPKADLIRILENNFLNKYIK